ncbi:MAG: kelch repeat-containing protein [Candidatus Binatia bacterium]
MTKTREFGGEIDLSRRAFLLGCAIALWGAPEGRAQSPAQENEGQALNLPANTWVARKAPRFPGSIGAASKHVRLTYDPDRRVVYAYGGDYCVATGCSGHRELWSYDVALNKWTLLVDNETSKTRGYPTGRCLAAMAYDSKRKVLWMTGGEDVYGDEGRTLIKGSLWSFNPDTRTWARRGPANYQSARKAGSPQLEYMIYDALSDRLFLPADNNLVGFFSLKQADGEARIVDAWSFRRIEANDPSLGKISFALDTKRNRAILYLPKRNETWSYNLATHRMSFLSRQALPAKSVFGMVYDSVNDVVVYFGGYTDYEGSPNVKALNQTWVLNLEKNEWRRLEVTGSIPPPRKGETLTFDSHNNVLVQMGGTGGWQNGVDKAGYDGSEVFLLRLNLKGGS